MHLNRSLGRGLRILASLNADGDHKVASIARDVGLPRTTTFRVLTTLIAEGYVARDPVNDTFHPTSMVRDLFCGFDDKDLLVQVANPFVAELGQRLVWPLTIATLAGTAVLLRQTTDDVSPLAVTHYAPGYRMRISDSASGLVLLAFSSKSQRQMLLDLLYQPSSSERPLITREQLERRVARVRETGYAWVHKPGRVAERSSLAVPVQASDDSIAALVVRFARSAVKQRVVLEKFLPELRTTAAHIVEAFATHLRPKVARVAPGFNPKARGRRQATAHP
jgi:IclR family transcriptional regulator, mhp operon transcriptional activator